MTGNRRGIIVQDRDRQLLRELSVMRVVDREQAKRAAGFHSTTRVNSRLLGLTDAGLLRRFFLGMTGGARKALYSMSEKGAGLVQVPYRGVRRGRDQILLADFFVAHQLWINEIYCAVKHEAIPIAGAQFVRWMSFEKPLTGVSLIPDGYAEVRTPTKSVGMFLEVDLGTESRSVWQGKIRAYLTYGASGGFAREFGQPQFRTVVVVNSERRLESLRMATSSLTEKIFWFATFDRVCRDGFWSAVWKRPTGDAVSALL